MSLSLVKHFSKDLTRFREMIPFTIVLLLQVNKKCKIKTLRDIQDPEALLETIPFIHPFNIQLLVVRMAGARGCNED